MPELIVRTGLGLVGKEFRALMFSGFLVLPQDRSLTLIVSGS